MSRGGQRAIDRRERRLDGLIELYLDGLPGKVQSATGAPEMLRWVFAEGHPALTQASLKQLQRVMQGGEEGNTPLRRFHSLLMNRFDVREDEVSKAEGWMKQTHCPEDGRVLSLVRYLRAIEGLEDGQSVQLKSLLGVIEKHLIHSRQLEHSVAIAASQRIDDVMFLWFCTAQVSRAIALFCELPKQSQFGAMPWLPRVAKGGGLRSSRHVFVESILRRRARDLGCESPVRQHRANIIANAAYPDDASGNAVATVTRSIAELLGRARLDKVNALHDPGRLSLDVLCTCLQYPSRSHALGVILRTMEIVDGVQRELLADDMSAEKIVKEFDASVYRVAVSFSHEMSEQVRASACQK